MKGLKVAGLLVCGLLFIGSSVEASGEFSYKNTVIAHRAPDGAIGFVAGPDLPVLKVFRQDGAEPAYYIRFDAAKGSFKKATREFLLMASQSHSNRFVPNRRCTTISISMDGIAFLVRQSRRWGVL